MSIVRDLRSKPSGAARVRFYRDLLGSIEGLKRSLQTEQKKEVRWKRAFWAAIVAALVASGLAVGAITSTSTSYEGASGEAISYSDDLTVSSNGHHLQDSTVAAATTAELTALLYPTARTGITVGHWYYQVTVEESAIAQISSGPLTAELFQDGTSLGTLTITQTVADPLLVEGVVLQWSLGTGTLPTSAAYVVKIS